MLSSRRLRVGLWAIALGGAVLAPVLWVMPAALPAALGLAVSPEPASAPLTLPAADPAIAEEIAVASIFAPGRTPPRRRYVPPESDSASAMTVESNAMLPAIASDSLALAGDVPRLFGTMVDSARGELQALLHLSGDRGPRLYGVGDRDGGFRVLSITPRLVVVRGPSGRVTLRLDPEENRP